MAATLSEVLMGLGSWDLDLDWDPEVAEQMVFGRWVRFWWGEEPIYTCVLLKRRISRQGIAVGGRSLAWVLGAERRGPVITDREYVAGNNKLSNGSFERDLQYHWKRSESSFWLVGPLGAGSVRSGVLAAYTWGTPGGDDVLASDESFEAEAGYSYLAECWVKRNWGTLGRLRLRMVFEGRFTPANLVPNPGFEDGGQWVTDANSAIIQTTTEAASGLGVLRLGPVPQPQILGNHDFEAGLTGWEQVGTWADWTTSPIQGAHSAATTVVGVPVKAIHRSGAVLPGETYRCSALIDADGLVDGKAVLVVSLDDAGGNRTIVRGPSVEGAEVHAPGPRQLSVDVVVPADKVLLHVSVEIYDHTAASTTWIVDMVTATRIIGNRGTATVGPLNVTPERTYHISALVRSGVACTGGEVFLQVMFFGLGRAEVFKQGPTVERTLNAHILAEFDVTPPSGYDQMFLFIAYADILGDSFYVDDVSLVDADRRSAVFDTVSPVTQASFQKLSVTASAPVGTDRVRVEIIADSQGEGWVVDDVALYRIGVAPAVAPSVVRALLRHPDTDVELLTSGLIIGSDVIQYDWRIRHQSNGDALRHLSRGGVVDPVREWRVNVDGSLDWNTAENLFTDRTDFVLREGDFELLAPPQLEESAEDEVSDVVLIGAERLTLTGETVLITGAASTDTLFEWRGVPHRRTLLVEDTTVDQRDYANDYAVDALEESRAQQSMILGLSDWAAVGRFGVGDWLYVYAPDSGIEDPANEMTHKGEPVWPMRLRATERRWDLGAGRFRAELLLPDGTTRDLPVRWSQATQASVTLGTPAAEFGQTGRDGGLLRFRASVPR